MFNLESFYNGDINNINKYISFNNYTVFNNEMYNRFNASIIAYNLGDMDKEDIWYVQQPNFKNIFMLPPEKIKIEAKKNKITQSDDIVYLIK